MAEDIRTEDIVVTELEATDDVKEGLELKDYAILGGIMATGAVTYEVGKKIGKKTYQVCTEKVIPWAKEHNPFKKKGSKAEETPEHEAESKKDTGKSKGKKSETKESTEK